MENKLRTTKAKLSQAKTVVESRTINIHQNEEEIAPRRKLTEIPERITVTISSETMDMFSLKIF